jgi:hypothetical protein
MYNELKRVAQSQNMYIKHSGKQNQDIIAFKEVYFFVFEMLD